MPTQAAPTRTPRAIVCRTGPFHVASRVRHEDHYSRVHSRSYEELRSWTFVRSRCADMPCRSAQSLTVETSRVSRVTVMVMMNKCGWREPGKNDELLPHALAPPKKASPVEGRLVRRSTVLLIDRVMLYVICFRKAAC